MGIKRESLFVAIDWSVGWFSIEEDADAADEVADAPDTVDEVVSKFTLFLQIQSLRILTAAVNDWTNPRPSLLPWKCEKHRQINALEIRCISHSLKEEAGTY